MSEEKQKTTVTLTAYEWHLLLSELEHKMRFANVDVSNAKRLWEKIANQLNEINVDACVEA